MKIKLLFLILLLFSFGVASYYGIKWTASFISYMRLSQQTEATILRWYIVKRGESHYYIKADFSYPYDNKEVESSWVFSDRFLNQDSAKAYIKKRAPKKLPVWYGSSSCGLERKLSYNDLLKFLLSVMVIIYFLIKNRSIDKNYIE